MPTFTVHHTKGYIIEADSEDEAREKFDENFDRPSTSALYMRPSFIAIFVTDENGEEV